MSTHDSTLHDADGHDHDHGHEDEGPHSTLRGYVTGFVLSVILTAIPFWF
ncbi:cytochrome o ubiquinol oxidase subunit IV, partial [Pandoraea nosoerga]|nr:cytochrome o ubiquinol oxidase subunit IV [Pandoraea nosoerga]